MEKSPPANVGVLWRVLLNTFNDFLKESRVYIEFNQSINQNQALLDRVCFRLPPFFLMIRQTLPAEGEAPVKVTPVVVLTIWGRFDELKSIEINSGYIRTHYCSVVLCYPGQQRLQPPIEAFTCQHTQIRHCIATYFLTITTIWLILECQKREQTLCY